MTNVITGLEQSVGAYLNSLKWGWPTTVWFSVAPENKLFPFVVYNFVSTGQSMFLQNTATHTILTVNIYSGLKQPDQCLAMLDTTLNAIDGYQFQIGDYVATGACREAQGLTKITNPDSDFRTRDVHPWRGTGSWNIYAYG